MLTTVLTSSSFCGLLKRAARCSLSIPWDAVTFVQKVLGCGSGGQTAGTARVLVTMTSHCQLVLQTQLAVRSQCFPKKALMHYLSQPHTSSSFSFHFASDLSSRGRTASHMYRLTARFLDALLLDSMTMLWAVIQDSTAAMRSSSTM